eukprot:4276239-Lingulodinium_polyedra.AAC.1
MPFPRLCCPARGALGLFRCHCRLQGEGERSRSRGPETHARKSWQTTTIAARISPRFATRPKKPCVVTL